MSYFPSPHSPLFCLYVYAVRVAVAISWRMEEDVESHQEMDEVSSLSTSSTTTSGASISTTTTSVLNDQGRGKAGGDPICEGQ